MDSEKVNMQDAINQAEWANPDSWSGPKWLQIYNSKRDSRVWVPKRHTAFGWTVNFAQKNGAVWLFASVLGAIGLVILSNIVVLQLIAKS